MFKSKGGPFFGCARIHLTGVPSLCCFKSLQPKSLPSRLVGRDGMASAQVRSGRFAGSSLSPDHLTSILHRRAERDTLLVAAPNARYAVRDIYSACVRRTTWLACVVGVRRSWSEQLPNNACTLGHAVVRQHVRAVETASVRDLSSLGRARPA